MRLIYAVLTLILMQSCQQGFNGDAAQLEGYWEIQKVVIDGQTAKEYTVNAMVDFISLTSDSTGLRKKLAPKLDGGFAKTNKTETFTIRFDDGNLMLDYQTPFDSWSEEVLKLDERILVTKNKDGLEYHYNRFEAKNVLPDE